MANSMNTELFAKDPMHGVTLEMILNRLVERYGWREMGGRIKIRCFNFDPSIKSSLQFLRKTPWARKKVEDLYWQYICEIESEAQIKIANDEEPPAPTDQAPS